MAVPVREYRALNTRWPFSRADARRAGIGLRELLSPRFHKIFYDCYVASTVPITTELRAEAGLGISPPGSYVSHFTAAQIWGAVVPHVSDVHLTVPGQAGRTVRRGVKAHTAAESTGTTRINGLPITTPVQTFLDLAAAGLDLVAVVVLGDSLGLAERAPGNLPMRPSRGEVGERSGAQGSALCTLRRGLGDGESVENAPGLRAALIERGATGIRRQFKTEWPATSGRPERFRPVMPNAHFQALRAARFRGGYEKRMLVSPDRYGCGQPVSSGSWPVTT